MIIYKQETDKSCGVACLRSIFNYYGNNFSEEDVWRKSELFHSNSGGVMNPLLSLGVTALEFGFDVEYVGHNPIITNNNVSENLEESLKEKSDKYREYGKYVIGTALEFLRLGGVMRIDIPTIDKIKTMIDKHGFILVEIRPAFINNKMQLNMVHKIIVVGYTDDGFKILDPGQGVERFLNFDVFLAAFYASMPELIIIKEKR